MAEYTQTASDDKIDKLVLIFIYMNHKSREYAYQLSH